MSHPHPELSAPAPLAPGGLRVIPLGGLGEVGRNMTVFEYDDRLLIVDCGVLFPEDHHPGVDLILPDFEAIRDRLDQVEALVLTHGHEDHIGATPYLLREREDIPLVGSELTLALLDSKLREHRLKETVHHKVQGGRPAHARPVRPRVRRGQPLHPRRARGRHPDPGRHSCCTPATSRWTSSRSTAGSPTCAPSRGWARRASTSSSPTPPTPRCPASPRPSRTSGRCSTGSSTPASSASSWPASPATCTASSRSSTRRSTHDRKAAYVGRSMVRNMAIARDLGYLHVPPDVLVDVKDLAELPPERQVLVSTGSQGEPLSALSRIAQRNHHLVHIEEGDTVILASSLIPGNENAVYRVINGLARWGANVVHKGNALVHVSGHASAGELLYCYNIVKPRNVMPGARRDPPHARERRARPPYRRAGRERRGRRGRRGRRPRRRPDLDRRQGRVRLRLRRRLLDRRRHRVLDEGPPDPGLRGLHLGDRGRRLGQREGRRRPGDPRPRLRRGRSRRSTRSSSRSSTRSTAPGPRATTTPTSSSRSSVASSAAGSTASTSAGR